MSFVFSTRLVRIFVGELVVPIRIAGWLILLLDPERGTVNLPLTNGDDGDVLVVEVSHGGSEE
jgi:hypothetical protein